MIISLLVAMDEDCGIGKNGGLPWRLSTDLKRFKALTMGHYIIMGRKTFESIGRVLPGRKTIVVTRNPGYQADGCDVVHSTDAALQIARSNGETEAIVIGGGEIFNQVARLADRIYLTTVHTRSECDVFFPRIDIEEWIVCQSSLYPADEKNEFPTTYQVLSRTGC